MNYLDMVLLPMFVFCVFNMRGLPFNLPVFSIFTLFLIAELLLLIGLAKGSYTYE